MMSPNGLSNSFPIDALQLDEQWIYGIAEVDGTAVAYTDGKTNAFKRYEDLASPLRDIWGMANQEADVEPQIRIVEEGVLRPLEIESRATVNLDYCKIEGAIALRWRGICYWDGDGA